MSVHRDRNDRPDELDRLLSVVLNDAVRGIRPPARLGATVCAAVAEQPRHVMRRSALRTLVESWVACLAFGHERRPMPLMMHTLSFADLASVSPGLAWSWELYRGRCDSGRRMAPGKA